MTGAMTNAAGGTDNAAGGAPFEVLFFVGLVLFLVTLAAQHRRRPIRPAREAEVLRTGHRTHIENPIEAPTWRS